MTQARRSLALLWMIAAGTLAGCGGSPAPSVTPSSRIQARPGSTAGEIILSAVGAQRIGIQTATVRSVAPSAPPRTSPGAAPRPGPASAIIPSSAVVYAPSGATYAFISPAPLTYVEVPITIDHVTGDSVFLQKGPRSGARVVTLGAEELYGVQSGVLAQT